MFLYHLNFREKLLVIIKERNLSGSCLKKMIFEDYLTWSLQGFLNVNDE